MNRPKKRLPALLLSSCLIVLAFGLQSCMPFFSVRSFETEQKALALIDQGTIALRQQKLDLAKGSFEAALEFSKSAAAFDGLGCVAFAEEDFTSAEDYFIRANRQDPAYANALANLALLYEKLGRSRAAYEMYQRAITQQPQNFRARNNFAAYLHDFNRTTDAKNELFKAMAIAKHPTILDNLKRIGSYE